MWISQKQGFYLGVNLFPQTPTNDWLLFTASGPRHDGSTLFSYALLTPWRRLGAPLEAQKPSLTHMTKI